MPTPTPTPTPGQQCLHPDILRRIISDLPKSDLSRCMRVSQTFFHLAGENLYREISIAFNHTNAIIPSPLAHIPTDIPGRDHITTTQPLSKLHLLRRYTKSLIISYDRNYVGRPLGCDNLPSLLPRLETLQLQLDVTIKKYHLTLIDTRFVALLNGLTPKHLVLSPDSPMAKVSFAMDHLFGVYDRPFSHPIPPGMKDLLSGLDSVKVMVGPRMSCMRRANFTEQVLEVLEEGGVKLGFGCLDTGRKRSVSPEPVVIDVVPGEGCLEIVESGGEDVDM